MRWDSLLLLAALAIWVGLGLYWTITLWQECRWQHSWPYCVHAVL